MKDAYGTFLSSVLTEGASTLIVTTADFSGGSNRCTFNCTKVHLIPLQTAAPAHNRNPTVSNSTSPKAVNSSPAIINTPTEIRLHVTCSIPNINALSKTQIGLDDLIIVKNVIDILTNDRFDSPTSAAVIKPHGIETPKNVLHGIFLTTSPPNTVEHADDML